MTSESARATTAAEARFRIDAPNSKPRSVKVIALDAASEAVVQRLARGDWNGASFLTASTFAAAQGGRFSMQGWLSDLAGRACDLIEEIAGADTVVMIGAAGENAEAAAIIAEAANLKGVMTTALILGGRDEAMAATLARLRPHASMLVIAGSEDYLEAMLASLRA